MIAIHHERGNFWLRLKLLLTLGHATKTGTPATKLPPPPKRRSHRTTAFFEMP
jgi:hypothetical protein